MDQLVEVLIQDETIEGDRFRALVEAHEAGPRRQLAAVGA